MLYKLFPDVKPKSAPPAPSVETDELKKRISILEGQVAILEQVIINTRLPTAIDSAVKMSDGGGRIDRAISAPPVIVTPAPVIEVDTSEAFLNAF